MQIYLTYSNSDMFQKKNFLLTTAFFSVFCLFNLFFFLDPYTASLIIFEVLRVGAAHISQNCISLLKLVCCFQNLMP